MKHLMTQTYLGLLLITPFLDRVWMCSLLVMPPEPFPLGLLCFLDFLPGFVNLPISKEVSKYLSASGGNFKVASRFSESVSYSIVLSVGLCLPHLPKTYSKFAHFSC